MMNHSSLNGIKGLVTINLIDKFGNTLACVEIPNLIVSTGLQHIAACLVSTQLNNPPRMTHMALGSSSAVPSLSQSALGGELGRVPLTNIAASGNTLTYTAMFGAGIATGAVVEAGIFNNSSQGIMLCRTTFPVINKGSTDSLAITWLVTIQ